MSPGWSTRAAAVCAVVLAALVGADPAAAHSELVSATPGLGEKVVVAAPLAVSLSFTEALDPALATMVVVDSDDGMVAIGSIRVDGPTVTLVTRDIPEPGGYLVRYRVVGVDGHPVDGETGFTVVAPEPKPNDPADAGAAASPESNPTLEAAASEPSEPSEPPAAATGEGADRISMAVGAVVVVSALALLVALARRRGTGAGADRS